MIHIFIIFLLCIIILLTLILIVLLLTLKKYNILLSSINSMKEELTNIIICIDSIAQKNFDTKKQEEKPQKILKEFSYQFSWYNPNTNKIETKIITAYNEEEAYDKMLQYMQYVTNNSNSLSNIHFMICLDELETNDIELQPTNNSSEKNNSFIRNTNKANEYENQFDAWER